MKICAVRLVHIAAFDKNYLNNTLASISFSFLRADSERN